MQDAELRKKHAAERLVNALVEERNAENARETAAARASQAKSAVTLAEKEAVEAFGVAEGRVRYIRYSDKVIIVSASKCEIAPLESGV